MHWFKRSIIRKMLLAYSIFILLIFCVYGFYLNMQVRSYFETESKNDLYKEAGQIATEIEMFMQKYIIITAQMKTNTDFINITKEIKDKSQKKVHPLFYRVTQELQGITSLNQNIALSYIAIDKANDVISNQSDYELKYDFNLHERPWYIEATAANKVTVTSPYVDSVTNELVLSIAAPVMEDGKALGAFALDLMVDDIYEMMKKRHIGEAGYAMLLDGDGSVLYHPDYYSTEILKKSFFYEEFAEVSDELTSGKAGMTHCNVKGKEYYIAFSPIENANWTVATIIPKEEVFAPLNQLLCTFYLVLVSMLLLTMLLFSLLQYSISKPIVKISRELEGFSNNNHSVDLPEEFFQREDEIGVLTKGLSFMMQKIAQYILEIEQKNKMLSEEIKNKIDIQVRLEMILQLLSKTDEAIFIIDQNYFCLYCNSAFEKITGYSQEELRKIGLIESMIHSKGEILQDIVQNSQAKGEIEYKNMNQEIYSLFFKIDKVHYDSNDYYIGSVIDITKYKQKEKDVYELKYFDSLTRLQSKAYFEEFVKALIHKENDSNDLMFALIIINIDDFRLINEAKGFEFGNKVLIALSEKLKKFEEEKDCLARMGNDEFAILKANLKTTDELYTFVATLDQKINSTYHIGSEEVFISASAGIGIYPKDADSFDVLLKAAASALNSAKKSKSNRFEFYNKEISNQSMYKYELQNKLRNALMQNEFYLTYQPQIDMANGKPIGIEALIRWKPLYSQENIMPNVFISLAEESTMILPIGEWVLLEACRFGYEIYSRGYELTIGVNLSRLQFKESYIVRLIHSILAETRFPAHLLELEITEGILMENQEECERILKELKSMGLKISIDDFGTGYSSLSYLKKFAVDKIKIDRSFIKDIPFSDNGVIAKTIIELAENLNLGVIAEGVETEEQVGFLLQNKCKEAQGFLFAKPMSKEDILIFLERNC